MTEWKKYTGSDEQIAEINESVNFMLKRIDGVVSVISSPPLDLSAIDETIEYLICNPHPLADMICQQARTGQPVWVRYTLEWDRRSDTIETDCTTSPDWNIPNAEYSFTPFDD